MPQIYKISFFLIVFFSNFCEGGDKTYGNIDDVQYVKNYDGDTITFNIPDLHPIIGESINIRVSGIDTPEIRGKCQREKKLAKQAKNLVAHLLKTADKISLKNIRRGKYFRIAADVMINSKSLADILIKNNLAIKYSREGKTKKWC